MIPRLTDTNGYPIGELIGASLQSDLGVNSTELSWWLLYCVSVEE